MNEDRELILTLHIMWLSKAQTCDLIWLVDLMALVLKYKIWDGLGTYLTGKQSSVQICM